MRSRKQVFPAHAGVIPAEQDNEINKLKAELEATKKAMEENEQKHEEDLKAAKAKFEQEKADLEAQRKSKPCHKKLEASKEEINEIWKDGFEKGLPKMFNKMKENMEEQ